MRFRLSFILISITAITIALGEEVPPQAIAKKGQLLLSDDFSEGVVGEGRGTEARWTALIPGFRIEDGVLVAWQAKEDHGAVGRTYLPMKDVIVEFRFRLEGTKNFNVVFDDQGHKGSHAGHICRIAFAPANIRLGDDKEGIMRSDIFAMRRDPATREQAEALLEGRGSVANVPVEQERWYSVGIEILGEEMRVSLDGVPVGYLKSSGIAHPTKTSFHFTVNGERAIFDDIGIWEALPTD